MAYSEDASTPAVATTFGGQTVTTASFTPPANSLLTVLTGMSGGTPLQSTPTTQVTDSSGGGAYFACTIQQEASGVAVAQAFEKYFSSSPGAITVTFAQTSHNVNMDMLLAVRVGLGAKSNQAGQGSTNLRGGPNGGKNWFWNTAPTAVGSWIYVVVAYFDLGTGTWTISAHDANTTLIEDQHDTTNQEGNAFGKQTNPTANLTPLSVGFVSTAAGVASGFAGVNIEILPAVAPVTVNLTTAQVNVKAISPVTTIGGKTVNLLTAQVNVAALTPTISTAAITSGGQGYPGSIRLTYLSPTVEALAYSISPIATFDPFGNQLPVGYQGPITAIQPLTMPVVTETWHALDLTVYGLYQASGNGVNGFFYRYTSDNEVELVWDIQPLSNAASPNIGNLPLGYLPIVPQNVESGWYGTGPVSYLNQFSPHLLVFTSGLIQGENTNGSTTVNLMGRAKVTLDNL